MPNIEPCWSFPETLNALINPLLALINPLLALINTLHTLIQPLQGRIKPWQVNTDTLKTRIAPRWSISKSSSIKSLSQCS